MVKETTKPPKTSAWAKPLQTSSKKQSVKTKTPKKVNSKPAVKKKKKNEAAKTKGSTDPKVAQKQPPKETSSLNSSVDSSVKEFPVTEEEYRNAFRTHVSKNAGCTLADALHAVKKVTGASFAQFRTFLNQKKKWKATNWVSSMGDIVLTSYEGPQQPTLEMKVEGSEKVATQTAEVNSSVEKVVPICKPKPSETVVNPEIVPSKAIFTFSKGEYVID